MKLVFISILACIVACTNYNSSSQPKHKEVVRPSTLLKENISKELSTLPTLKKDTIKIDTLNVLSDIKCLFDSLPKDSLMLTAEWLQQHQSKYMVLSPFIAKIAGASYCLCKVKEDEHHLSFIFINEVESHYSLSAKWVTVKKKNKKITSLDLAYDYGSELMDQKMVSTIINDSTICKTTTTHYRYLHGIGTVDSTILLTKCTTLSYVENYLY